jgi:hypothetical protein
MSEPVKKKPNLVIGVRYRERKKNPPSGLKWLKTEAGDTLENIAYEYGLREIDLALMNWHVEKTDEINWYLYEFLGWRTSGGKFYVFSPVKDQNKGWILVPDLPSAIKKGPPKSVDAVRNGQSTLDSKFQIYVVEQLANGSAREVSGKWLYVFSGNSGKDFGYKPPPPPPGKDAPPTGQPGSAFPLRHPFEFHLKEKPDKLEYEILITSDKGASSDFVKLVTGLQDAGKPYYQIGNNWYFLSDQTILKNATTESRTKRTTHAFRKLKTVTIELTENKRFYFLLSPVQLGPEAIKYAMGNPGGLTPLLRRDARGSAMPKLYVYDPDDPQQNVGPTPDDVKENPITLKVIDPYGLAESIAEQIYPDALKEYVEWFDSKKNATIEDLQTQTGWATLDHLFVAEVLKSIRDSHQDKSDIDDELADSGKWLSDLKLWEKDLHQRHAEINAAAHRSLLWLIKQLESPGHKIIETAILRDTNNKHPHDAIDIGHGILHWAACTEQMFALEPGVVYLRDVLDRTGSVPADLVAKHFKGLDKDAFSVNVTETHLSGWRYGYVGLLKLQSLQEFVSPPPPIPSHLNDDERRRLLAGYNIKKRDNLIKVFNNLKVLPVEVKPLPLPALKGSAFNWTVGSAAAGAMLDFADKWTFWMTAPGIQVGGGADAGRLVNRLAKIESWFDARPELSGKVSMRVSYTVKGFAIFAAYKNFTTAITSARYDYQTNQSTTSLLDKVSAVAGLTLVVQDVLAEIAAQAGSEWAVKRFPKFTTRISGLARVFPQLISSKNGPTWGLGAAQVVGVFGKAFAGLNVVAMFVSGATTAYGAYNSGMKAASVGDYTAARFYGVAVIGGVAMTTGAVVFGIALWQAGAVVSATGIGATVGVVLFMVGGIVAAIGTIAGWLSSSSDYEIFARKCFLGKQGKMEPRFGVPKLNGDLIPYDPPDWSMAAKSGKDTWAIGLQKRAILNLLGKFKVKTEFIKADPTKLSQASVKMKISLGLFMTGSTVEVALYYEKETENTVLNIEFDRPNSDYGYTTSISKGKLFTADNAIAPRSFGKSIGKQDDINVTIKKLNYDEKKGKLLTTVTIRYPGHDNVIRTKQLVDNSETESNTFK